MARRKATPAAEEVEELEEDLELEELDEAVEEDSKPAKKTRKKRADAPAFGIQELVAHIKEETDKDYTPREVRTLLRKMARDGSSRVNREVSAENRSRYSWSGPDDAEVQAVIAAVGEGEIEADKKAALDKLKENKAKKDAAEGKTPAKKAASKKKAATPPPADEDDDEEFDEDDED